MNVWLSVAVSGTNNSPRAGLIIGRPVRSPREARVTPARRLRGACMRLVCATPTLVGESRSSLLEVTM